MDTPGEKNQKFNPADLPPFPPTDETGDVDLSLIEYNLSLTIPERIRQHDDALQLVRALENVRTQWYGTGNRSMI